MLAAFILITLVMAWMATGLRVDAGFTKLVPLEHPYMRTFLKHRAAFGGADRVAVALVAREGDIFTPEFFALLQKVNDAVFFVPGIDRTQVYSVVTPNVRFNEVVEDGIVAGNVLPANFKPTRAGFARVRENIIKAGIVGRLVANDFSGALVSARLQEFHPNTGERLDYLEVARALETIRREAEAGGVAKVHIIGFAKVVGEIAEGAAQVLFFFGLAVVITALFIYAYTRSVRLTAMPLACSLVAVIWQLGALTGLGFGVDPMSILVPFLVFAIGVSHGVQMVNAVQAEGGGGISRRAGELSPPAAAGFRSARVGRHRVRGHRAHPRARHPGDRSHRQPGGGRDHLDELRPSARGAFLSQSGGTIGERAARSGFLDSLWSRAAGAARPRPAMVTIAVAAVLLALGARYAPEVRVGDQHQGVPELRASSTYNLDTAAIVDRFNIGVDVLTVIVETIPQGCVDYGVMRLIDEFEWRMRNVEGVRSVVALTGIVRKLNAGWNEGNLKWRTLPRNRHALAESVSLVPTSTGLLNGDCSAMPVLIYTADHKAETIRRVVYRRKGVQ